MTHLLDTNAWITYLRQQDLVFMQNAQRHPTSDLGLCSIVLGELLYGAHHSAPAYQAGNFALIAQLRQKFRSLPFDDNAAEEYGKTRHHIAALGTPIGPNDLLIASIAKTNGLTLVTNNTREFGRVPGLTLEDWTIA